MSEAASIIQCQLKLQLRPAQERQRWFLTADGRIRTLSRCRTCPICFLAQIGYEVPFEAARSLGLSDRSRGKIVHAADRRTRTPLRRRLLAVTVERTS